MKLCSNLSKRINEPISSTASFFQKLILVESNSSFESEIFDNSRFDKNVIDKFKTLLSIHNDLRILLIKKSEKKSKKIKVYTIFNNYMKINFHTFEINDYDNLLDIDFDKKFLLNDCNEKILLVCTHGKHDRCCGKYGKKIYNELSQIYSSTWECSHIGGDRYAANVLQIPEFNTYGRVESDDLPSILNCINKNKIYLKKYRGNSSLNFFEQSLEIYLRSIFNELNSIKLLILYTEEISDNVRIIQISLGNSVKKFKVVREESSYEVETICFSTKEVRFFKYLVYELDIDN